MLTVNPSAAPLGIRESYELRISLQPVVGGKGALHQPVGENSVVLTVHCGSQRGYCGEIRRGAGGNRQHIHLPVIVLRHDEIRMLSGGGLVPYRAVKPLHFKQPLQLIAALYKHIGHIRRLSWDIQILPPECLGIQLPAVNQVGERRCRSGGVSSVVAGVMPAAGYLQRNRVVLPQESAAAVALAVNPLTGVLRQEFAAAALEVERFHALVEAVNIHIIAYLKRL